jgi:hypothetical protein
MLAHGPQGLFACARHEQTSSRYHDRDVNLSLPGGHHPVNPHDFLLKLFYFSERGLLVLRSSSFLRRLYRKIPEKAG